jgi:hypothetical protein
VGTYIDAAVAVLSGAHEPLTDREITDRALAAGLLPMRGRTPAKSMSAALYLERARSPRPRVEKVAMPGPTRARRGSVRWRLARRGSPRRR